ncbi:metallophosphoesterase [Alkalithermobacter paradoxus]|uniref:3',5'-cyclic adenosine monophosphate phosphodiesterase CpdA n=1 Tax=Alkalithermobacter paradoxus TaxID=29349 RepID=A0A1V4I8H4_9FIRM|nr:3',5'-cyclic adenosine monophosphate phosphodiesterase CpdA [[Clostridium] thermoalcaliphilum]
MALYAIGDLHFGKAVNKPMDIFGDNWQDHREKIIKHWSESVNDNDTVLVVGDISWGINLKEAMPDLEDIGNLPGKKILVKGNHDYWWSTVSKLNKLFDNMKFLQNNYYTYENYAICGTRGWLCPNETKFDEEDEKIYNREVQRLKLSLDAAKKDGFEDIIVITHYPPTNDRLDESNFTKMYEEYKVKKVIYGHLHGKESFKHGLIGERNNVEYSLASCDYTDFKLIQIMK